MDANLSFFNLPFVDGESSDLFAKSKIGESTVYDDFHGALAGGSLLGADDDLAQFLSAEDTLEEPDLNGPTTLHCEICKKQFDNAKKYYGHLRVHSKENLWICDKCPNQKFSTKQQLMKHSLVHKPLGKMWPCPQCTMAFEALWRLQQHMFAKHFGYRPHKCDVCDKSFYKKSDLAKHESTHTNERKYKCTVCNKGFKDMSNLGRHMYTHNNEKNYCCPGCGNKYKQLANIKRHTKKCPLAQSIAENKQVDKTIRKNYCKECNMTFQYKSALLEHVVRQHSNTSTNSEESNKEDKTDQNPPNVDTIGTVDNIVDDILSAEDDYMTMSTQNQIPNTFTNNEINNQTCTNHDQLMHIEFLNEINQIDDELLYNNIDFDNFQTSQIFNNDISERNEEILFDFTEEVRSLDQDLMNAFYQVKADYLPDELLNVPQTPTADKNNETAKNPEVSVNECTTIFESDVDLEASTNLAANLNQLIGENSVQYKYISTDDDDTFIISLNSEIDAEQLTDMLNIGAELEDNNNKSTEESKTAEVETTEPVNQEVILEIIQPVGKKQTETTNSSKDSENTEKKVVKVKKKHLLYGCLKCNKVFKRKNNYKSHLANHNPALRIHKCSVCHERFGYRPTLNKHYAKEHQPKVLPAFNCHACDKKYTAAWKLKDHILREHEKKKEFVCDVKGCQQSFFKKHDLTVHKRHHTGERQYVCKMCDCKFVQSSHLHRHVRLIHKKKANETT